MRSENGRHVYEGSYVTTATVPLLIYLSSESQLDTLGPTSSSCETSHNIERQHQQHEAHKYAYWQTLTHMWTLQYLQLAATDVDLSMQP